jgi:O-antigen ligase
MVEPQSKRSAIKLLFWGVIAVNLAMLPSVSYDPINSPKLFLLGTVGCGAFVLLVNHLRKSPRDFLTPQFLTAAGLIVISLISMILGGRFADQFFGVFGRNTGIIAIFSLSCLYLLSTLIRGKDLIEKLSAALMISGGLALAYGAIQVLGLDPVDWAPTGYTKIFGFLGNPNFQSAFLGMFSALMIAFVFDGKKKNALRVLAALSIIISILVINVSDSLQGFLVLLCGFFVNLLMLAVKKKAKLFFYTVSALTITALAGAALGMLKIGPLSRFLYKDSIQFRGDYWRTAWDIGLENPFFGVGIDRFGDYYRLYRDEVATLRRGPDVTSNSPHNVFLDFLSNSGFIGFSLYLLLHVITFVAILRFLRKSQDIPVAFIGLTAAWVGYIGQSIISVNQLGLAIWGWVLMGALLGFCLDDSRSASVKKQPVKGRILSKNSKESISAGLALTLFLGMGLGSIVSVMPLYRQVAVVSALKSGDIKRIENQAYAAPTSAFIAYNLGSILSSNNLNDESLRVARAGVETFPKSFELWTLLSIQPGITEEELREATNRMRLLDPFNPKLK